MGLACLPWQLTLSGGACPLKIAKTGSQVLSFFCTTQTWGGV